MTIILLTNKYISVYICISQYHLRPAPPPPPPPLPPADPWALAFLDGKFPGVGTFKLSNSLGWGRERGQIPCPPSTLQHFSLIAQSNSTNFKHFNMQFFVSSNVFLSNSARILTILTTTCTSLWFKYWYKIIDIKLIERCKVICYE